MEVHCVVNDPRLCKGPAGIDKINGNIGAREKNQVDVILLDIKMKKGVELMPIREKEMLKKS